MIDPRMVIAIDPGGTTGIARWIPPRVVNDSVFDHRAPEWTRIEIGPCDDDANLRKVITCLSGLVSVVQPFSAGEMPIHLIVEPFEFRQDDSHRDKIDYIAGEIIGALRVWAFERSYVRWIRQSASYGVEGFWTDEKVKKIGLWEKGKRHAMDATKHVLMYRTFKLGDNSPLMLLR